MKSAKATIEHLFGNHQFCDKSWCWPCEIENVRNKIKNDKTKLNACNIIYEEPLPTKKMNNEIEEDHPKAFEEVEAE